MKLLARFSNKYFICLSAFLAILFFFDKNDLITQAERRGELRDLRESKAWYDAQIQAETKELEGLKSNPAVLEKTAREKYLMKREQEELFLVPEKPDEGNNPPE
jgi:hypothetical protein